MKLARPLLWGLVFLGAIFGLPAVAQTTQPDMTPSERSGVATQAVQGIASATDPSSAIAAYADASRAAPHDIAVEEAFMRRMIDFGLPALAEVQAKDLNQRDPNDGLAWAVTAYVNAKRGEPELAIAQIQIAAARAPDDPFVQRTAGQLLAWYDSSIPAPALPDVILNDLPKLREKVSGSDAFAESYRLASAEYNRADQPEQVAQAEPPSAPATLPYDVQVFRPSTSGTPSDYVTYYDQGNPYTVPYATYPAPVYTPVYYPYYDGWDRYWPGGWWWFGSSVIVVKDCFKHGRKFDCFDKSKFCNDDFVPLRGSGRGNARFDGANPAVSSRGDVRVTSTGGSSRFVGPVQQRNSFVGPVQQAGSSGARSRQSGRVAGGVQQQNRFVGPVQQQNRFVGPVQQPAASSRSVKSSGKPSTFVGPLQNPAPRSASAAKGSPSRSAPAKVSGGRAGGSKSSANASRGGSGRGNGANASRGSSGGGRSSAAGSRGGGGGARGGSGGGGGRGGGRGR